ncbi:MAG: hypothetical protein ACMUHB_05425, partial [Thermoplasmatota archaeon]
RCSFNGWVFILNIEEGRKEQESETSQTENEGSDTKETGQGSRKTENMDENSIHRSEDEGEVQETGDGGEDEVPEVFDEDEKALFEKLMRKIQDAGDLDKELDSDFSQFTERVESVVDSVERIENIERSAMEDMIYKVGETPDKEASETQAEAPASGGQPPIDEIEDGRDEAPAVIEEDGVREEGPEAPIDDVDHKGIPDQIQIPSETPYTAVKEGEVRLDEKGEIPHSYGTAVENVISKMLKLIRIKISKGELEKAIDLFNASHDIGGNTSLFKTEFIPLAKELGIELSGIDSDASGSEGDEISLAVDKETTVLDPELAGEINALEKKARVVMEQLDSLIKNTDLPKEDYADMKAEYVKAAQFFKEKRFHRSYETATVALENLKVHVQDDIDNKIQDTLYKAKEMLEDFSNNGEEDQEVVEKLRGTMDRAMKAYLTNEFEKADLLAKRVMDRILESTEPDGGPLHEKLMELKRSIKELKDMNIPSKEFEHIQDVLRSAETLLERRDSTNAERILATISNSINEAREKGEKYIAAKEMEIKIANRVQRLRTTGHDVENGRKKLGYLTNYFKEERYDDVLVIGQEIEAELESIERLKREMDSKEIFDRLEELMENVDDLDDADSLKEKYGKVSTAYQEGDFNFVKTEGKNLAELLSKKTRTIGIDRAKRIASVVIEARLLSLKLRGMQIDTTEWDRRARKARNILKEGNHKEGISQLEEVAVEMKEKQLEQAEFLKSYINIYRDSLEVLMDRHREEAVMYHLKRKHVPILRKMAEVGKYQNALDNYRSLVKKLSDVMVAEDKKEMVESDLNEVKFEIYKRKEQGLDISEPLSLYTMAQKRWGKGDVVPAEYLIEVSKRYCDTFMPMT